MLTIAAELKGIRARMRSALPTLPALEGLAFGELFMRVDATECPVELTLFPHAG
jgi:hypothetical protein